MADPAQGIRIATWNIHRAIGRDRRVDHGRIIDVLREIAADVIALQEVAYRSADCDDTLARYAAAIEAAAVEGITLLDERGHYGNAILTRLPVCGLRRHDLSVTGREPRGAIELTVSGNTGSDRRLRIVATHLGLRPGERRQQVGQLVPLFENNSTGVDILLGDLNEWFLAGRPLRMLRRVFGPARAPATFPARRPVAALDRIWVRPAAALGSLRVHRTQLASEASDHLPLVADLTL